MIANLAAQVFRPVETTEFGTKAAFQSLVAQPEYAGYSPEVMRITASFSKLRFFAHR